jgi:hypothetical protein
MLPCGKTSLRPSKHQNRPSTSDLVLSVCRNLKKNVIIQLVPLNFMVDNQELGCPQFWTKQITFGVEYIIYIPVSPAWLVLSRFCWLKWLPFSWTLDKPCVLWSKHCVLGHPNFQKYPHGCVYTCVCIYIYIHIEIYIYREIGR